MRSSSSSPLPCPSLHPHSVPVPRGRHLRRLRRRRHRLLRRHRQVPAPDGGRRVRHTRVAPPHRRRARPGARVRLAPAVGAACGAGGRRGRDRVQGLRGTAAFLNDPFKVLQAKRGQCSPSVAGAAVADLGISMEFDTVVALQEIFPGANPQLLRGYLEASENVLYAAIRSFRDYLASDSATTSAGTSTSGGMFDMTEKEASGSPQGGLGCRSWVGACCGAGSPWSSGRTTCRRSSQRRHGTPRSWTRHCHSSTGWTRPTTCSSTPSATSSQWMGGGCPHGSGVSDLGIHKDEWRQPRTRPLVLLILLGRTCCLFHVGYMTAMESYRLIFLRSWKSKSTTCFICLL